MDNALMREEISKIKAIPSLKVRKPRLDIPIRFVYTMDDVILITGEDIYICFLKQKRGGLILPASNQR